MKNNKQLIPMIAVALIAFLIGGVGGIYASRLPQVRSLMGQNAAANFAANGNGTFARGARGAGQGFGGGTGAPGQAGARAGFGGMNVFGKVTDINATTMTITMMDGSSKIVTLSGSTQYQTVSSVAANTIKAGDTVRVLGPTNSDGSVTAQNVMVNPPMPSPAASGTPQASASPAATY